jgi:hypothetical protein
MGWMGNTYLQKIDLSNKIIEGFEHYGTKTMTNSNITISKKDMTSIIKFYSTMQIFFEKYIPVEDIYEGDFIVGLKKSISDTKQGLVKEVKSLKEFIN